jgi:hypothetical protein
MIASATAWKEVSGIATKAIVAFGAAPVVRPVPVLVLVVEAVAISLLRINCWAAIDGAVGYAISVDRFAGWAKIVNIRLAARV